MICPKCKFSNDATSAKFCPKCGFEYAKFHDIMIEKFEKAWIDEIVELMVDVVCSKEPYIRINKQEYPHEVVKSRFLKIDSSHIEYIYFALRENCSNVRNIRAFLITTIYRSFETSDNWFSAKVNYDTWVHLFRTKPITFIRLEKIGLSEESTL